MSVTHTARRWYSLTTMLVLSLGLAAVLVLVGCGSDGEHAAGGQNLQPTEDVVLFDGGETPAEKEIEKRPKSFCNDQVPGIALKTNGHFYDRVVSECDTKVHSFHTRNGIAYQVELVGQRHMDDPDLFLSRNADPRNNEWKRSRRVDPYMDGIVFRSTQDGTMYVGVHGYDSGPGDGTVEYYIHVRKCRFAEFQQ